MKKKLIRGIGLFTLIFMALAVNAFIDNNVRVFADDLLEPYQYKIEFDNGTTFYMYVGNDSSKSGLYDTTEPFANIYLLEPSMYFYKNELVFSADGFCFAYLPWTTYSWSTDQGGVAVAFYSNGSLTKQYLLDEVIIDMSVLEPSVSHVVWEDKLKSTFDAEDDLLIFTAIDGTTTGFRVTTGEMIFRVPGTGFPCSFCGGSGWGEYWCRHSGYLGWKIIGITVGSVFLTLALAVVSFLVYKSKKKKAQKS